MTDKITGAAQMLKFIGFTQDEAKKAADMLSDAEITSKAVGHADSNTQHIPDHWTSGHMHSVPSADVLKVGPSQESSGAGAEHMVHQYSNPAPQNGMQVTAERLAAELGQMRGYMKSIADAHNELAKAFGESGGLIKSLGEQNRKITMVLAGVLSKAEDEEDDEEDKKKPFEKATASFAKAQKLLDKAKKARESAKAATFDEVKKSLKRQSKLLRKAATRYLLKADGWIGQLGSDADVTKSVTAFLDANPKIKADMEEMRDKDKDEEKAKKAKKAMKAFLAAKAVEGHSDAKGNQADKQDGATGNQDDSAVKAATEQLNAKLSEVDMALKGFGMLKTDIAGLMDTLAGRSVTPPPTPLAMMKSDPLTTIRALDERIEKAAEVGTLDTAMEHAARDMLNKYQATTTGVMSQGTFKTMLDLAPRQVKEIFKEAA